MDRHPRGGGLDLHAVRCARHIVDRLDPTDQASLVVFDDRVKTLVGAQPVGDRKGGVVWHTQGSGKSLSMVFYTGKIVLAMDNPTVLVIGLGAEGALLAVPHDGFLERFRAVRTII